MEDIAFWKDDRICTNCEFDIIYEYGIDPTKYCPNCGCKMMKFPKRKSQLQTISDEMAVELGNMLLDRLELSFKYLKGD